MSDEQLKDEGDEVEGHMRSDGRSDGRTDGRSDGRSD